MEEFLVDPVVVRVERTDRLSFFVDRLDRLPRLVDNFTTRLDLADFQSTYRFGRLAAMLITAFCSCLLTAWQLTQKNRCPLSKHLMPSQFQVEGLLA